MEEITTVGVDLAKNVFSLHGVDGARKTVLRRTVRRERLVETVAALSPCLRCSACSKQRQPNHGADREQGCARTEPDRKPKQRPIQ